MTKALVILSGGQDSTTCLFWARQQYDQVVCLTFDYGQRHRIEIESARQIAAKVGVAHEIVNMQGIFTGSSPLTDLQGAVEQYESADKLPGGLEATFVPGRNIMFLSVAASRAYVAGADDIVIGVSQEDFGGYPDCREDFIAKLEAAIASGLDKPIKIQAPLMHLSKRETVELAARLPGCLESMALTTTCYNGVFPPCRHCHACLLRERGFNQAGVEDPLLVAGREVAAMKE